MLQPIPAQSRRSIQEAVLQALRAAILSGALSPGVRLVERKLAEQLNVSRTPVREAVLSLEREGLVIPHPRRGMVVSGVSEREAAQGFSIRAVLEGLAARWAAARAGSENLRTLDTLLDRMDVHLAQAGPDSAFEELHEAFHLTISALAGSDQLYQMIQKLREQRRRVIEVGYAAHRRPEAAQQEHREIVAALRAGDGTRAERAVIQHVENSRKAYFRHIP